MHINSQPQHKVIRKRLSIILISRSSMENQTVKRKKHQIVIFPVSCWRLNLSRRAVLPLTLQNIIWINRFIMGNPAVMVFPVSRSMRLSTRLHIATPIQMRLAAYPPVCTNDYTGLNGRIWLYWVSLIFSWWCFTAPLNQQIHSLSVTSPKFFKIDPATLQKGIKNFYNVYRVSHTGLNICALWIPLFLFIIIM